VYQCLYGGDVRIAGLPQPGVLHLDSQGVTLTADCTVHLRQQEEQDENEGGGSGSSGQQQEVQQ
jgi:hypothetical protein